jgi:hypothetical protein
MKWRIFSAKTPDLTMVGVAIGVTGFEPIPNGAELGKRLTAW